VLGGSWLLLRILEYEVVHKFIVVAGIPSRTVLLGNDLFGPYLLKYLNYTLFTLLKS